MKNRIFLFLISMGIVIFIFSNGYFIKAAKIDEQVVENQSRKNEYVILTKNGDGHLVNERTLTKKNVQKLKSQDDIIVVEKNGMVKASVDKNNQTINNPIKYEQRKFLNGLNLGKKEWNLQTIKADKPMLSPPKEKVRVALIDSGVDFSEDIDVCERKNFIEDEKDISNLFEDLTGHGTSVAGIMAAKNNNIGISGINPYMEIYSARVLGSNNQAPISRVVEAIYWAIEEKVNIISLSFGTSRNYESLQHAIQDAYASGILIIGAAGNTFGKNVEYPAAYDEVLSIGSVDSQVKVSDFSATGNAVDLVAPGESILTTGAFGGLVVQSGTSMAVPHVVGVASILWQKNLACSNEFIKGLLLESANSCGKKNIYGYGLIDLNYAKQIYDEFKLLFTQHNSNSISVNPYNNNSLDQIVDKENVLENSNSIVSFDDVEYVEGSWFSDDSTHEYTHNDLIDGSSSSFGNLNSKDIYIIKAGAVYQDRTVSNLSGMVNNPQWHGYYHKTLENGNDHNVNYLACVKYLTEIALKGSEPISLSIMTGFDASAMNKIDTLGINGNNWGSIFQNITDFSTETMTIANTNINRKYFLFGMAIHAATDIYSHSTYELANGKYVYLSHTDEKADDANYVPKRFAAAAKVSANLIECLNNNRSSDVKEFSLSPEYYDGSFYIRNLLYNAKEIAPTDWTNYKSNLKNVNYATGNYIVN